MGIIEKIRFQFAVVRIGLELRIDGELELELEPIVVMELGPVIVVGRIKLRSTNIASRAESV
jgi:hypothetical protein